MADDLRAMILEAHRDHIKALYEERIQARAPQFDGTKEEQEAFEKGFRMGIVRGFQMGILDGVDFMLQVGAEFEELGGESLSGLEGDDDLPV